MEGLRNVLTGGQMSEEQFNAAVEAAAEAAYGQDVQERAATDLDMMKAKYLPKNARAGDEFPGHHSENQLRDIKKWRLLQQLINEES